MSTTKAKIYRDKQTSKSVDIAAPPKRARDTVGVAPDDLTPQRFSVVMEEENPHTPTKARSQSLYAKARSRFSRISLRPNFVRIASYTGRLAKPANKYLRWNLLFTFLIFFFLTSSLWTTAIPGVRNAAMEIVVGVLIVFQFLWLVGAINACRYLQRMFDYRNRRFECESRNGPDPGTVRMIEGSGNSSIKALKHLIGLTIYKEPVQLMIDTIESLARQPNASNKLTVVVGMEEGTPNKEEKTKQLMDMFTPKFDRFYVTVHPKGLPGDIPGKCSNMNYAARKSLKWLREDKSYGLYEKKVELLVTTGDCDSIFGEHYFEALEDDYFKLSEKERHHTVWQSPLFYCINLDKSPFFVRVTGLMRAFFMMAYLIPWNINTMSIFTLTLQLYEEGEYTHPGYQMDDIIALIRWTLVVSQKCTIRAIPVATLSGPTSGANYWQELKEWARQIRRWTIGAAEVFHYFVIKAGRLPISVSVAWSLRFVFYYGILLCISPIYGLVSPSLVPFLANTVVAIITYYIYDTVPKEAACKQYVPVIQATIMLDFQDLPPRGVIFPNQRMYNYALLGMLALSYFWLLVVFAINKIAEGVFPDGKKDETGILRSVFHWLMSFPTIVGYCLVELYAFMEVTVRGKDVCKHGASKKDGLVGIAETYDINKDISQKVEDARSSKREIERTRSRSWKVYAR